MHIQKVDDPQLSCLPFASAANCENHLARIVTTLQRLAPHLSEHECLLLLGELALCQRVLESIESSIRGRVSDQAKALGLIA